MEQALALPSAVLGTARAGLMAWSPKMLLQFVHIIGALVSLGHLDSLQGWPQEFILLMLDMATSFQDTDLTCSFIRSISTISLAAQQGPKSQPQALPHSEMLLSRLLGIIEAEPRSSLLSPVRQEAMVAIGHLSRAQQPLSGEQAEELLGPCLASVLALPPQEFTEDLGPVQALHASTMASLEGLLQTLLELDQTPERLQRHFRHLGGWLESEREWERARAVRLSAHLLRVYLRSLTPTTEIPPGQFSSLAGTLGPHTCAVLGSARQEAEDAITCLLDIQAATAPWSLLCQDPEWVPRSRPELPGAEPRLVQDTSRRLARLVSRVLPAAELLPFAQALLEGLGAGDPGWDAACALWFQALLSERSTHLMDKVFAIMSQICVQMCSTDAPGSRRHLAQAVSLLAQHHPEAVVTHLLTRPEPLEPDSRELWAALAAENLLQGTLQDLLERMPRGPAAPQEAVTDRVTGASPFSVVCAIRHVMDGAAVGAALGSLLADLCHVLLLELSRAPDSAQPAPPCAGRATASPEGAEPPPPIPRSLLVAALRAVLAKGLPEVGPSMDKECGWSLLEDPRSFPEGVCLLTRALVRAGEAALDGFLPFLSPTLSSPWEGWRVTGTAFHAELLAHPALWRRWQLKPVLRHLVGAGGAENEALRWLAARGLGNVAQGAPHKVNKYKRLLLDALRRPLAKPSSPPQVVGESLGALRKLLGQLGPRDVGRLCQPLATQARARFSHEDGTVRAAAFGLFGALAGLAQPRHRQLLAGHVRGSWAALLLHVCDPHPTAATACSAALLACAPLLGLPELESALASWPPARDARDRYRELLGTVCQRLAQDSGMLHTLINETCLLLASPLPEIRLEAAKLAGTLIRGLEAPRAQKLDLNVLLNALRARYWDPSAAVEFAAHESVRLIVSAQRQPEPSPTLLRGPVRLACLRRLPCLRGLLLCRRGRP